MIGFYGYTVWLTYASLLSAIAGIFMCFLGFGHPYIGSMFLLFSGLCDAFDGKVARTKKNRTEVEKQYGIQLDSLADLVAFGVLPICIGIAVYRASAVFDSLIDPCLVAEIPVWAYLIVYCAFALGGLIRLAYFNVTEVENQKNGIAVRKQYTGLPITSSSLIFPTFLLIRYLLLTLTSVDIAVGYYALMLLTAFLFVSKISVRKPGFKGIMLMVGIGVVEFVLIWLVRFLGYRRGF